MTSSVAVIEDTQAERAESARWFVRATSESLEGDRLSPSLAETGLLGTSPNSEAALFIPTMAAVASYVPANVFEVVREFRFPAPTFPELRFIPMFAEDEWRFVAETATRAEVEELQRIWALPYPGDVDFNFRRADN